MVTLFATVLEMSVKAAVVIVAIMIARAILIKAPKKFSYLLWSVAAFRLLIPTSFESVFSIFGIGKMKSVQNISSTPITQDTPTVNTPVISGSTNVNVSVPETIVSQPISDAYEVSQSVIPDVTTQTVVPTVTQAESIDWESIIGTALAWIWVIGMAAMLIYGIISYIKLSKKMQNAILFEDNVYFSDGVSSPFTLGFLKPRIYLPFGLSEEEMRYILAHERCHIKRFDHIIKPFAFILLSVHWFNPLCWLAFNRMGLDMEMSCDEKIIGKNGGAIKKEYSRTLLALASEKRFPAPSPIAFNDSGSAKTRIKHALNWKKPKIWMTVIAVILCVVTLVACMSDAVSKYTVEFDDVPYTFTFVSNGNGKCKITDIKTDFEHKEYFEIIVPEKSPDGDTVVAIRLKDGYGFHKFDTLNVPTCFSAERFEELKSKIGSFEKESLEIDGKIYETARAAELFESYYVYLSNIDSEVYNASFYVLEPTLNVAEYNIISTILTYFADYTEEDCFEDSAEFCTEILKDENDEDMINRVFNYFYHSAKYVTKVTVPQSVKLIKDVADPFSNDDFSVDYVIAETGEPFPMDDNDNTDYNIMSESVLKSTVLYGHSYVVDSNGNEMPFAEYKVHGKNVSIDKYVFTDLDGDELNELVIYSDTDPNFYVIARYDHKSDTVYMHWQNTDDFRDLKADGTFRGTHGDEYDAICRLEFNETDQVLKEIALKRFDGEKYIYQIEGKDVSEQEVNAYFENWEKRRAVAYIYTGAFEINVDRVTDELSDSDDYIHFVDDSGLNSEWDLVFTINSTVTDVKFFSIEEQSDADGNTTVNYETLYTIDKWAREKAFVVSTYINDVTPNRGISFVNKFEEELKYAIRWNGEDGSLYLERINENVNEPEADHAAMLTFRVAPDMPYYVATAELSENDSGIVRFINIAELNSDEILQSIIVDDEHSFQKVILSEDVNFDGYNDLLLEHKKAEYGNYYKAFIWDAEFTQFVHVPSFEGIPNASADMANKRILGVHCGSMVTTYNIYYYDAETLGFVCENTLSFEFSAHDEGENVFFCERKLENGEYITVDHDTLTTVDPYKIDKNNDRIAHYFEEDSFWDLNSEIWKYSR